MRKNILMPVSVLTLLAINLIALNYINNGHSQYFIVSWAVILFSAVLSGIAAYQKLNNN